MSVTVKIQAGRSAEIMLHGDIGMDGISSIEFADVVRSLGPLDRLTVGINSQGGDAFEGIAIHNFLTSLSAEVTTRNDALAASAASVILMAGDRIQTYSNALAMIHNAWSIAVGNADDLRQMAGVLEKLDRQLCAIYARRTGLSTTKIADMMAAETWLDAREARSQGFVDEVIGPSSGAKVKIDAGRFKNLPRQLSPQMEDARRKVAWGLRVADIRRQMADFKQRQSIN